jgi:uncharacterized protein with von Willebrand factor type A (vWA) domain
MPDRLGVTRVVDELLWSLRRGGFRIATSQAIDAARAIQAVGLDDPLGVREALAAVVVDRPAQRARFDALYDAFFAPDAEPRRTLWERLTALGFSDEELEVLRDLLARAASVSNAGAAHHLGALLERGAELDRLLHLAGISRAIDAVHSPLQVGFFTYRVLDQLGLQRAHERLAQVRAFLNDALGEERGAKLASALRAELDRASEEVRAHIHAAAKRRNDQLEAERQNRRLETAAFTSLSDAEVEEVRRAVRAFAERLRGAARVRLKRARRGRIDPHRTLRRAVHTGGVPFVLARRARRRERLRLVLLCDVSDSVRQVARFMLEFVYVVHELFDRTRSFVFVSELGETTDLFAKEPVNVALGKAYGGGVVSVSDNSNYGRVLRAFDERVMASIDRRTTVVILGDGRTNYHDDASEVLDRVRARARALLWLCPEDRAAWSLGDSAMSRYAPKCTSVIEVRCAKELEVAARRLVANR